MSGSPLAARLASLLPRRPLLAAPAHATPELLDRLVPQLNRPHVWDVMATTSDELDDTYDAVAEWAAAKQWTVTTPGYVMLVHTPAGAARIQGRVAPLQISDRHDAFVSDHAPAHLVTADHRRVMFLIGSPDRDLLWRPPDPDDRLVRPRPTPRADRVVATLRDAGYGVATAAFTQTRRHGERLLLAATIMQLADAARDTQKRAHARIDAWEQRRLLFVRNGRLALQRLRRDILAVPRDQLRGE